MTTQDATPPHPYRIADREGEGWLRNGPHDTYTTYPRLNIGEDLTYEELNAQRGPLRPVGAMNVDQSKTLSNALAAAGKKGVATLLVALNQTASTLIVDGATPAVFTAGRPGSWEAAMMRSEILWLGENISSTRTDPAALATARDLLLTWITGPVQPELADGLASILGKAAEKAGGWHHITDRWLSGNATVEHWTSAYRPQCLPFDADDDPEETLEPDDCSDTYE